MSTLIWMLTIGTCLAALYWALCIHGAKKLNRLSRFQSKALFVIICISLLSLRLSPILSLFILAVGSYFLYKKDILLPFELKVSRSIFIGDINRLRVLLCKDEEELRSLQNMDLLKKATDYITDSTPQILDLIIKKVNPPITSDVLLNVAMSENIESLKLILEKSAEISSEDIRGAIVSAKATGASELFLESFLHWAKPRLSTADATALQNFLKS